MAGEVSEVIFSIWNGYGWVICDPKELQIGIYTVKVSKKDASNPRLIR